MGTKKIEARDFHIKIEITFHFDKLQNDNPSNQSHMGSTEYIFYGKKVILENYLANGYCIILSLRAHINDTRHTSIQVKPRQYPRTILIATASERHREQSSNSTLIPFFLQKKSKTKKKR